MSTEKANAIADFIYEIEEAGLTPHVVIRNSGEVIVPPHLKNETLAFNVSAQATGHRLIDADGFSFSGRFSGLEFEVYFPLKNIIGVVSKCGTMELNMASLEPPKPIVSFGANWYNFIGARGSDREETQKNMKVVEWPELPDRTIDEADDVEDIEEKRMYLPPELTVITGGVSDGIKRGRLVIVHPAPTSLQ